MTLHDISDAVAFQLKAFEFKALVDLGGVWEKVQAEPSDLRLNREGDGKTASQYTISVAKKFDNIRVDACAVGATHHIRPGRHKQTQHFAA
jgi:hypothetical protein